MIRRLLLLRFPLSGLPLLGLLLLLALPASGDDCEISTEARNTRPNAESGPTEFLIGMFLVDVIAVNDRDQSVTVDFNVNLRWQDSRLARDEDSAAICTVALNDVWSPNLRILNQRQLERHFPQQLRIDRSGNIHYDQRFYGELRAISHFADFPFDMRELRLELVAVDRGPDEITWVWNEARTGRSKFVAVSNWEIAEQSFHPKSVALLPGMQFAAVDFTFSMTRHAGYFIWNTIVPLVMIVLMSWGVFWVNPAHLGAQLGLAGTSMLSLIAYRFTLGGVLPPVPYFTRMDIFLNGASFLVFLSLVEAVLTSTIADRGNIALAERIDRLSSIVFPASFGLIIVLAFML